MARNKVVVNRDAVRELLRNTALVDGAHAIAQACNAEAGGGYESAVYVSPIRARGRVWAFTSGEESANRMLRNLDKGAL